MIPSILSTQTIQGLKTFLSTTFHSTTPAFSGAIERFVEEEGNLFKGPYISIALPFQKGRINKRFFPEILSESFVPYYHQELAFERLSGERSQPTLVATGTGSGKTESFMYPILEYCRQTKAQRGIKAIVIYPMNALATDQAKRFAKAIASSAALDGVRVGLFVGGDEGERHSRMSREYVITDKDILRRDPPDVLLTNYKMLDFLLMRPKDQPLWRYNIGTGVLKYLAVDEIHTFDGAQGTDLASLLRRLRAKLQIEKGVLGCIGTSATLGTEGSESIRKFATTVFSEVFDESSVIAEYRIDAEEFLTDVENDYYNFPGVERLEALAFENYDGMKSYLKAQCRLWFMEEPEDIDATAFRVDLGRRLKELSLFKLLLRHAGGAIVSKKRLIDIFRRHIPAQRVGDRYYEALIDSLLALLSWARGEPLGSYLPPFLHLRLQLWVRELTRMVGSLEAEPKIRFSHDLSGKETQKHYPLIHCRECHAMGWGGYKKESDDELLGDLDTFYKVFFARDPRLRFIFPVEKGFKPERGLVYYIDIATGREALDDAPAEEKLLIWQSDTRVEGKPRSHNDCPFCGNKNALTILGARAASLSSVMIGESFASGWNDDKKMITFSDSVQDAAHRAGFFGARSWQFTMRMVMQQALEQRKEPVKMSEFSQQVAGCWRTKLGSEERYVGTMIAPDMTWLKDYDTMQQSGKLPQGSDIARLVDERLDWHICSEYGYRSHIGRTLERSGASTVRFEGIEALVARLLPRVQNDFEALRDVDEIALGRFLYGLLQHMRKQGAIDSHHLGTYLSTGGNLYAFTKYQHLYMPSFTFRSRSPTFLTTGKFQNFERIHRKSGSAWCDAWAIAHFHDKNLLIGGYVEALYRRVMEAMVEERIAVEKEVSGAPVWGLSAEKLWVDPHVERFLCDRCGDVLMAAKADAGWAERLCCLRKGCGGHYERDEMGRDYYRTLYRHGDVERIVAKEHTGLLERKERERIEWAFIGRTSKEPWKPNLLSATPTLEMGIDIGDLGNVLLCSMPPTGASYLQRIGRAGRKDGNALNATVANAQPHDLYFYSEPMEMMQGAIESPGVFIDASAILQRQFLAYCLDRWVSEKKVEPSAIPTKLSGVLNAVKSQDIEKFPLNLIHYIEERVEALLEEFFGLYEGELHEKTMEEMKLFAMGHAEEVRTKDLPDELKESMSLSYKILHKLEVMIAEQNALGQRIDALRKKIKAHKKLEARDKDWEERLKDFERELSGLRSVRIAVNRKETFEFFTNEGLLPNYAFPENGVVLKSIIYRRKEKIEGSDGTGYETFTFEYERPGSSAISELAPNNRFYAGGRKVRIDQIDMKVSEIETWRFCDRCSYSGKELGEPSRECPRCGSKGWADIGQKRELIRLRRVMATTNDRQSRLMDDAEQREPLFYTKQLLIDIEQEQIEEAWATKSESVPFGFEFVRKAHFKEINFGEFSLQGDEVTIAGKQMPRQGFVICRCCGKVQEKRPEDLNFKPVHTHFCECTDPKDPDNFVESLYLYRDFDSEAIRMLLPMTDMAIDEEKLHSLIAAFQMGLKIYFHGAVDHLRVGLHEEGVAGEEYRKQFLVLYDTIPGGTGYLRQLMRQEHPIFEVLELALDRLNGCICNEDPEKDGCYRCIYAYRNNFDRPLVSREAAKKIIKEILVYRNEVEKTGTLSEVSIGGLFDSELEAIFLKKLAAYSHGEIRAKLRKQTTRNKKPGYLLELGDRRYEIEQQVTLGEKEGVASPSRADFVLYPEKGLPIVVFMDGYTYHQERIDQDSAQRMAIVASKNYRVWSLTWDDLESDGMEDKKCHNFLGDCYLNPMLFKNLCSDTGFTQRNSFEWLMELLLEGDEAVWRKRASAAALSMMQGVVNKGDAFWESLLRKVPIQIREMLEDLDGKFVGGKKEFLTVEVDTLAVLEGSAPKNDSVTGLLYLDDREGVEKATWTGVLRLFNLFQFLPLSFWTTQRGLQNGMYDALLLSADKEEQPHEEWAIVYEEALDDAKPLVKKLMEAGVPIPEVGYEIVDEKGVVLADTELAWPNGKVAVVWDKDEFCVPDWEFFAIGESDELIKALKERG